MQQRLVNESPRRISFLYQTIRCSRRFFQFHFVTNNKHFRIQLNSMSFILSFFFNFISMIRSLFRLVRCRTSVLCYQNLIITIFTFVFAMRRSCDSQTDYPFLFFFSKTAQQICCGMTKCYHSPLQNSLSSVLCILICVVLSYGN